YTIAYYNYLVQQLRRISKTDFQICICSSQFILNRLITNKSEDQHITHRSFQTEIPINVRHSTHSRITFHTDISTRNRFSGRVINDTLHINLLCEELQSATENAKQQKDSFSFHDNSISL